MSPTAQGAVELEPIAVRTHPAVEDEISRVLQLIGVGMSFDFFFYLRQWRVQSGNGSPMLKPGF
jgi:hypothetical protein